jgi:hypothetical protein
MRVVDVGGEAALPILSVAHPTAIFIRVVVAALRAQERRFGAAHHTTPLFLARDLFTLTILTLFGCWGEVQIDTRVWTARVNVEKSWKMVGSHGTDGTAIRQGDCVGTKGNASIKTLSVNTARTSDMIVRVVDQLGHQVPLKLILGLCRGSTRSESKA